MKYYIDRSRDELFAYESDGSQDTFINPDLELLDDSGLAEFRAAQAAANAPTLEEILIAANAQRDSLLAKAALRIAPLQDAVDLGDATDDEMLSLKLWKRYRISVNRVSEQDRFPGKVQWPESPT